jgi:hypothetical protein
MNPVSFLVRVGETKFRITMLDMQGCVKDLQRLQSAHHFGCPLKDSKSTLTDVIFIYRLF